MDMAIRGYATSRAPRRQVLCRLAEFDVQHATSDVLNAPMNGRCAAGQGGVMIYTVAVDFFGIDAASGEQARAVMAEMLQAAGFTDCAVTAIREV